MTPSCFKKDLGKKHIKYNSYNELAYLHKKYFTPDSGIYDMLGIKTDERYVIMRFVSRTAVHDIGHKGLCMEMKMKAAQELRDLISRRQTRTDADILSGRLCRTKRVIASQK